MAIAMNRLTRLDTVFTEAPVYFITACTEKRRHLLADDETHDVFYKFCHQARDLGVLVGRYVLLPDHLHLFVWLSIWHPGLGVSWTFPWHPALSGSQRRS